MTEAVHFVTIAIGGRHGEAQPGARDDVCRERVERDRWWHGALL
jgi:hypothetical protein